MFDFNFFKNAVMLGLGLTMDAFSVSLVAGMNEPNISKGKTTLVAGTFSVFQALMPLIGWFLVTTLLDVFSFLQNFHQRKSVYN
jgi:putative Mn2+ efflux pump MntP